MNAVLAIKYKRISIKSRGIALVELIVSLALGLVIIAAVGGIMISNMQSFRTTRALSTVQESTRMGFELLARDVRQAGGAACGNDVPIVNILNPVAEGEDDWRYIWGDAIQGYAGNQSIPLVTNRVTGTDGFTIVSTVASGVYVKQYNEDNNSANFVVGYPPNMSGHGLESGDILMICNERQGTIFQMTSGSDSGRIVVNTGKKQSPGNCTKGLGPIIPGNNVNQPCNVNGNRGPFGANAVIAKISSRAWYVGNNGRPGEGGRSLYMAEMTANGVMSPVEIAVGVHDMQLRYRQSNNASFVPAASVSNWGAVNAVEVTLILRSQDQTVSVDAGQLSRTFGSVITLRNRVL